MTSDELRARDAELRQCIDVLAKVGEGISSAFEGIGHLMVVGAATIKRAKELLDKAQQGEVEF